MSNELPLSFVLLHVRRGSQLQSTSRWNVFTGSWCRSEVVIYDMILPSAVAERDEAMQGLRLWAFSSCLHDDFGLLGVTSDVVHPLSLVFDIADRGRWDAHQLA